MEERWKDVVGYEGRYMVSNLGNVRSLVRANKGKIYDLRQGNSNGYKVVNLSNGKKSFSCFVHRLVAEAFISNPDNLPAVNHKNWIRSDNRVENLEWCTYSYNNWYKEGKTIDYETVMKRKNRPPTIIRNGVTGFTKPKSVICVETGEVFESVTSAARATGVQQSNVSRALCGRQRTSGGFHWKYVDEDTRSIGTLTIADGLLTDWHVAREERDGIYISEIFDMSDLRKMRGHIKIIVRDEGDNKEIRICSADFNGQLE